MDTSFTLKDGRPARIEIWNGSELERYVEEHLPTDANEPIEGFVYFCLDTVYRLIVPPRHRYEEYKLAAFRSPLERQPEPRMPCQAYHRAVVALDEQLVIGLVVCDWRLRHLRDDFWRYSLSYIDIHKDHKNKGVGTHLMRALDQAAFLKGKIIQPTIPISDEGKKWISHVLERELHGQDYALLLWTYDSYFFGPPTEPGIYDHHGKRITPTTPISSPHPSPSPALPL